MKATPHNNPRATHCPTWDELARHLVLHISWLHQRVPQTKASRAKIEQWRKQLGMLPTTRATERAQREGRL
jgi:hypothetical protein